MQLKHIIFIYFIDSQDRYNISLTHSLTRPANKQKNKRILTQVTSESNKIRFIHSSLPTIYYNIKHKETFRCNCGVVVSLAFIQQ